MHLLDMAHWHLLAALNEQGTLSAAAAALGVTQSAATQRLREAERRLGVVLASKRGRSLVLTEAGLTLAKAANIARPLLEQAESDAIWQGKRSSRQITLAWRHFDPQGLVLRLVDLCGMALPDYSLQVARAEGLDFAGVLTTGAADLALVPGLSPPKGPLSRPVTADRLVAIFPLDDTRPVHAAATPQDFADRQFLTYDLRPEPGWEYDRFFARGQAFPGQAVKIETTELICRLVSEGAGASILPSLCVALSSHRNRLRVAELENTPIRFSWHLLHGPHLPPSLLDHIQEEAPSWPL